MTIYCFSLVINLTYYAAIVKNCRYKWLIKRVKNAYLGRSYTKFTKRKVLDVEIIKPMSASKNDLLSKLLLFNYYFIDSLVNRALMQPTIILIMV